MDAALFHSLLEANCSLVLAEELLLDGWGPPLDPEGRREASGTRHPGAASLARSERTRSRAPRARSPEW